MEDEPTCGKGLAENRSMLGEMSQRSISPGTRGS